jgi:hypothetical protein
MDEETQWTLSGFEGFNRPARFIFGAMATLKMCGGTRCDLRNQKGLQKNLLPLRRRKNLSHCLLNRDNAVCSAMTPAADSTSFHRRPRNHVPARQRHYAHRVSNHHP